VYRTTFRSACLSSSTKTKLHNSIALIINNNNNNNHYQHHHNLQLSTFANLNTHTKCVKMLVRPIRNLVKSHSNQTRSCSVCLCRICLIRFEEIRNSVYKTNSVMFNVTDPSFCLFVWLFHRNGSNVLRMHIKRRAKGKIEIQDSCQDTDRIHRIY
jgi:hypothetical protein